jgi:hypothetical protein
MEKIKHLKIETATHIFPKFMRMQGTCLTHACIPFFARTDVGAVGATDSLVQSMCWVEPGCRDDRPGLPLTIGSSGLPLYLPYIYIYIYIFLRFPSLAIEPAVHPRAREHRLGEEKKHEQRVTGGDTMADAHLCRTSFPRCGWEVSYA